MPALPFSILGPLRAHFLALIEIADTVVFDHLIAALVFGAGYERIADEAMAATTLRRRRDEWIHAGFFSELSALAVAAYGAMIGLNLDDVAVAGCITKAPLLTGAEASATAAVAGRGKGKVIQSQLCDGADIPLAELRAAANRRDQQLLAVSLEALVALEPLPEHVTVHLDAGYDYKPCRAELAGRAWTGRS